MTRRKYDIEWRSDHMSTGVSWWDENNSANCRDLRSYPWLGTQWWDVTCPCPCTNQLKMVIFVSIINGQCFSAYDPSQTAVSSFCNLMPVCCSAVSGGEVYKCFFLCRGRLSRWSSLSLSSRTITSLGLTNAKVSVSSKSWCFASFCFVGILTTFNFATAVCEQHPTTNYIGHKTKRWQQTTQWCQLQTTAMICRISHPGDAEIPGTLRDISTFQLISI